MKSLLVLACLLLGTATQATECENHFPNAKELYECVSVDSETTIITENSRIIYIAQLACLNKRDDKITFIFDKPWFYHDEVKVISENENGFSAYKSEGVYPSGNIMRRYSSVVTINASFKKDGTIEMKYKKEDKHLFGKNDLRGIGNYSCTKIR